MSATLDLAALLGPSTPWVGTQQVFVIEHEDRLLHLITADHMLQWNRAFDQWLAELPSPNTRRAYQRAWNDLLDFTHKQPWTLHGDDVRDWIQDLDQRPLHAAVAKGLQRKGRRQNPVGYSASTIKQYLAGVSSFYTFARERYTITDPHGRPRTAKTYPSSKKEPPRDGGGFHLLASVYVWSAILEAVATGKSVDAKRQTGSWGLGGKSPCALEQPHSLVLSQLTQKTDEGQKLNAHTFEARPRVLDQACNALQIELKGIHIAYNVAKAQVFVNRIRALSRQHLRTDIGQGQCHLAQ
jgi:hypothetical protein